MADNYIKQLLGSLVLIMLSVSCADAKQPLSSRPEVAQFINQMAKTHGFDRRRLTRLMDRAEIQQDIIDAITRPAESKPWYEYRPIFVTKSRIAKGVQFMDRHAADLDRAQAQYGVPPEIITAILGVETYYGQRSGTHRVLDSLVTLAFDYPPRSDFFRSELESYLLLTRDEHIDPLSLMGSYAGAMGQPQFISSSYRSYAVDFDGDGRRDLIKDTADAIGSVANYFQRHGWQRRQPVVAGARVAGDKYRTVLDKGLKPSVVASRLGAYGITADKPLAPHQKCALIQLQTKDGPDYWLGLQNFYVITRYNHSPLYAMAVYQLSEAIKAGKRHEMAVAN